MQTFLQLVARDLYLKKGNDLSRTLLVFPNKRAHLFFNEYLAAESDKPLWSPAALSISDLFRKLSTLQAGDTIRLVCELYNVFREVTQSSETLDDFYFWGELLIGDFDDIDKNLVDAGKLFANLQDLKNIMPGYDFLSPEQEEAIKAFFSHFSVDGRTELKERFISLWDKLGEVYNRYRDSLLAKGIAYEGMLYREVMETLDVESLKYDTYVFVGFNVLNGVETRFFQTLQKAGKAMFYWDYDVFYTCKIPNHEAGEFIRRNLEMFPNELPEECFDRLNEPKNIRYLAAATENAQARYLPDWINGIIKDAPVDKECAVVLCNETLLLPVLHSLPEAVEHVNITMGFPLTQTPVYGFISAALSLQSEGYRKETGRFTHEAVSTLLKHPYTRRLSALAETLERELTRKNRFYPLPSELQGDEFLSALFTPCNSVRELCAYLMELLRRLSVLHREGNSGDYIFDQLCREALFGSFTSLNRLYSLMEIGVLDVNLHTFRRLAGKLLAAARVPFHGEPAIGLQIMGVLETRNLDFTHLVMLSLNEGQLPKSGNDASFVPYNLRKAFGMTTLEHKNAVYAYYFYRLIQRARNITLIYNTSQGGLNRGEPSRFLLQWLVEGNHPVRREYLEAGQSPRAVRELRITKTPEVMERLHAAFDSSSSASWPLSPSALNAYLDCRMRFYYRYVVGLRIPDEVSPGIDSSLFGTLFHLSAQWAYQELTAHGKTVRREDIERMLADEVRVQAIVDRAFSKEFFKMKAGEERPEYNGVQLIHSKVIAAYLRQLLRNDLSYAPFEMVGTEQRVEDSLVIDTGRGKTRIRIGGTIDRIDAKGDTLRIVDYKTGGTPRTATDIGQLFTPSAGRPGYVFQAFLYAYILSKKQERKVAPALLYIHRAASESYSPIIEMGEARQPKVPVTDFSLHAEEFGEHLLRLLEEIFSPQELFTQSEDVKLCSYCDFRTICGR